MASIDSILMFGRNCLMWQQISSCRPTSLGTGLDFSFVIGLNLLMCSNRFGRVPCLSLLCDYLDMRYYLIISDFVKLHFVSTFKISFNYYRKISLLYLHNFLLHSIF